MRYESGMKNFVLFAFCSILISCTEKAPVAEKREIPKTNYETMKRNPSSALKWTTPEGWTEKTAGGMRLASFQFDQADVSIISLPGLAGGFVANINRWRGQLGLPTLGDDEVVQQSQKDKAPLAEFRWVSLQNQGQGILGAVFSKDGKTIFVKARGEASTLKKNEAKFLKLCRSLKGS